MACRGIVPGMGPDSNSPAMTMVVPSQVHILLGSHSEDGEQLFLGVAQVHVVHARAHWLIPLTQASQGDPARLRLGHPQGQHLPLLPELSQSGPHQLAHHQSQSVTQARLPRWRRPAPSPSLATARNGHRNTRWRPRAPFAPLPETLQQSDASQPEPLQSGSGRVGRGYPQTLGQSLPERPGALQELLPALSSSVVLAFGASFLSHLNRLMTLWTHTNHSPVVPSLIRGGDKL